MDEDDDDDNENNYDDDIDDISDMNISSLSTSVVQLIWTGNVIDLFQDSILNLCTAADHEFFVRCSLFIPIGW